MATREELAKTLHNAICSLAAAYEAINELVEICDESGHGEFSASDVEDFVAEDAEDYLRLGKHTESIDKEHVDCVLHAFCEHFGVELDAVMEPPTE